MAFWNRNKFEAAKPSEEEIREERIAEIKTMTADLTKKLAELELNANAFREKYVRSANDGADLNALKARIAELEAEREKLESQKESGEGQKEIAA